MKSTPMRTWIAALIAAVVLLVAPAMAQQAPTGTAGQGILSLLGLTTRTFIGTARSR